MGDADLDIYKIKIDEAIKEAKIHFLRIERSFEKLQIKYSFPITEEIFNKLLEDEADLTLADQIIYRFAKAQDVMGTKLFISFMAYNYQDVNRPFRDILNALEKLRLLDVDDWVELRKIRNEIAHDYSSEEGRACKIINHIYKHRNDMKRILENFASKV